MINPFQWCYNIVDVILRSSDFMGFVLPPFYLSVVCICGHIIRRLVCIK